MSLTGNVCWSSCVILCTPSDRAAPRERKVECTGGVERVRRRGGPYLKMRQGLDRAATGWPRMCPGADLSLGARENKAVNVEVVQIATSGNGSVRERRSQPAPVRPSRR